VRGRNVYIAGLDTQARVRLPEGGVSTGTLNGVHTLLEKFLSVRWLFPGDIGDDVPLASMFSLPPIDITESPRFSSRRVPYLQDDKAEVRQWMQRQKLGYSIDLNHAHNWNVIEPELFDTHPDWFAASQGIRVPPTGRYKLETTNSDMVAAFASRATDAFRRDPTLYSFSLSPSDTTTGWSDSPESRALYDVDPNGVHSVTPLILKFYNDVARKVRASHPDKLLCGYIYADYLYPPSAGIPKIEPNVCLVLAPSIDYGFQLFRPTVRREFARLLDAWRGATPNMAYYDLPVHLEQDFAAPTPPAPEILSYVFVKAADVGMKGIYVYGIGSWGYAAVTNYAIAKLAWNPELDARSMVDEFYDRAYGHEAGLTMKHLYDVLEDQLRDYYLKHAEVRYVLTPEMLKDIYARHYEEIENLYLQASLQTTDMRQRQRLELFGRALAAFRWNLERLKLIPQDTSPLSLSDDEMKALLEAPESVLALAPAVRSAAQRALLRQ
jgi:hypothetical protein